MSSSRKILCTGNPDKLKLAKAIKEIFPNADFISLSNGYDLSFPNRESIEHFKNKLIECDVFINSARIQPGGQENILKIVHDTLNYKTVHVFNIGSSIEYSHSENLDLSYAKEKQSLRDLSIALNSEKFKTTHMPISGVQFDNDPNRLDPYDIARTIKWVLEQKFQVPIIGVEKVPDERKRMWRSLRG